MAKDILKIVRELKNTCEYALQAFEECDDKNNLKEYMTGRRDACISILNEVGVVGI